MKYIEELQAGDCCNIGNNLYIVTSDFKKNGTRLLIHLNTGFAKWVEGNTTCDIVPIFTVDTDNNVFIPIKEYKSNENHIY